MKYVYLVKERFIKSHTTDTSWCGIAYYSSLKKATKDYDDRKANRHRKKVLKEDVLGDNRRIIYEIDDDFAFEIALDKYEVN